MRFLFHVLPITILFAQPAFADRLRVCSQGCDFSTVQAAVDQAASGDVIAIAPGVYRENVTINDKSLSLHGVGNRTILGKPGASVLTLQCTSAQPTVTLVGMVIQGGLTTYDGGGIANNYCSLVIRDSVVTRNYAAGFGGAIYSSGPLTVQGSLISANRAASGGGILSASNDTAVTIIRSVFRDNVATCGGGNTRGGSALLLYGTTQIRDSSFFNNWNMSASSASVCRGTVNNAQGNLIIERSVLDGNYAGIANGGAMTANNVDILASDGASQAVYNAGSLVFRNGLIAFSSGLPLIDNAGTATFVDTSIVDSNGGGSPYVIRNSGSLTLTRDLVTGNFSEGVSPAVLQNSGTVTLRQTTISGNTPETCLGTDFSCPVGP